ncbi:MAG: hypothetical protein AAB224_00640 [Gemmatimonadota bacterium]
MPGPATLARIPWRRWSIVLHGDVGYLAVAMTLAYAISGIAVNHIADIYALALILLAVTGLFVIKGKQGITRRGGWLTAAGTLVPVGYWFLYLN